MPEPLLYFKAMLAAAAASVVCMVIAAARRSESDRWWTSVSVFAALAGLSVGFAVLAWQWSWPPRNGLDRLLAIAMPAALGVELAAGVFSLPRWLSWLLRIVLACSLPRILLHGSTYLRFDDGEWTAFQATVVVSAWGGMIASVWGLLLWLSRRSPSATIPISLGMATQCAGICVMLAGYIKGGAAAFPLAGTLIALAVAAHFVAPRSEHGMHVGHTAIVGLGVIALFGTTFIGRYFGRLATANALVITLAPLLCWVTELPWLRCRKPWLVESIRLAAVSIPLVVVLVVAKNDFDRNMAPLLGQRHGPRNTKFAQPSDFLSVKVPLGHY